MKNFDIQLGLLAQGSAGWRKPVLVPLEVVARLRNVREAYRACVAESGMSEGEVAAWLDIDEAQFSRILSGQGRYLPAEKLAVLETVCSNKTVTQYLAFVHGFALAKIQSELEEENDDLRRRLAEKEKEIQVLVKYGVVGQPRE